MEDKVEFPGTSIFLSLGQQKLGGVAKIAETRRYQSGEWITHYEDVWPYFFFIKQGQVTVVKESFEGRSLVLTTLGAGDVFWGMAFFVENAGMPASLHVSKEVELLLWSRERLMPIFLGNGALSWELASLVIQRVQLASEIVQKLAFHPVEGRLARLLLEQTETSNTPTLARDLTLDEMAARIGTTREVVCRFLHRFSDRGLIQISRTEFVVSDSEGLKELALRVKG
jgi:CRP/FNR family transcriptional regulator, cyclic AMP receptor protein